MDAQGTAEVGAMWERPALRAISGLAGARTGASTSYSENTVETTAAAQYVPAPS